MPRMHIEDEEEVQRETSEEILQSDNPFSMKCPKIVVVAANVIFLIFGCVLAGVGAAAQNSSVVSQFGNTLPSGMIALGVFVMLMSFFGCFGAWRESRFFLGVYFVVLLVMTILVFAVGLAVYVKRNDADSYISSAWKSANNDLRVTFQNEFECCGLNTFNDTLAGMPCNIKAGNPCLRVLSNKFQESFTTLGGCGIAFAVLQVLFLIFVGWMMRGIAKKQFNMDLAKLRFKNKEASKKDKKKKGKKSKKSKKTSRKDDSFADV